MKPTHKEDARARERASAFAYQQAGAEAASPHTQRRAHPRNHSQFELRATLGVRDGRALGRTFSTSAHLE